MRQHALESASSRPFGVSDALRVILEVGKKRRVVAGAMDWPGLDRWGTSEDDAIEKLLAYAPRYAGVAERAGLAKAFAKAGDVEVVERVPGSSSTDFWGIAHVPSQIEIDILPAADLERRLDLLRACWTTFDEVSAGIDGPLVPGPRSAGRTREQIIRHVYISEPEQFSRKVEIRTPPDAVMTPDGRKDHRLAYLAAIRAYNADGRPARTWPIQFLVRRTAHHVMDHAWELEDRDPARQGPDAGAELGELEDAALDPPGVRVVLVVRDAGLGQAERDRRGVGHEQVGMDAGPLADAVLQQPVRHRHGRSQQVAPRPDRLADRVTPVEDRLEVEVRDGRARGAHVVCGGDRPRAAVDERPIHRAEILQDAIALAVQACRGCGREDRVALELDHREVGLDALDHRIQQVAPARRTRRGSRC